MRYDLHILLNAIPGFVLLLGLEVFHLIREHRFHTHKKDVFASMTIGLIAMLINFLSLGIVTFVYSVIYQYRLFTISSGWWIWVICFFADDFSYYWFHRMSHQVRFLWASHKVHHSSERFSLIAGIRLPWTGNLTGTFLFWAWMPLIGIEPEMVLLMKSISAIYQFWLHTESIKKMPKWFEAVFNTPSHHRVHHSSDLEYLDKNHAGTLIVWDKLFGTFKQESFKAKFGLTQDIKSFNPAIIAFHEWKKIFRDIKKTKKSKDRLHYFFNSPGWSHDGTTLTTKELQSELKPRKNKLL